MLSKEELKLPDNNIIPDKLFFNNVIFKQLEILTFCTL